MQLFKHLAIYLVCWALIALWGFAAFGWMLAGPNGMGTIRSIPPDLFATAALALIAFVGGAAMIVRHHR